MKNLIALAAFVAASPAFAHSGAHLHPHGSGSWLWMVLLLSALCVPALLAWLRGRK